MFFLLCFAEAIDATCGVIFEESVEKIINIEGCIFVSLTHINNGGAVLITNDLSYVNISFDSFENCSTLGGSSNGGAIFCHSQFLNLSSVCCSSCSAHQGSFFFFELNQYEYNTNADSGSLFMSSVSTTNGFKNAGRLYSSFKLDGVHIDFNYINSSDTSLELIRSIFVIKDLDPFDSTFCTLSNCSRFKNLFEFLDSNFSICMSNIVGNDGIYFSMINSGEGIAVDSCVFAGNSFHNIIYIRPGSENSIVIIRKCWFDESENSIISKVPEEYCNLTLELCNFTSTNTLSFTDDKLVKDGVSCGIRLPSPSSSVLPTPSPVASAYQIPAWGASLIAVVSIAFCTSGGWLVWYYTRKHIRHSLQPDIEAISLLRNLENSYG